MPYAISLYVRRLVPIVALIYALGVVDVAYILGHVGKLMRAVNARVGVGGRRFEVVRPSVHRSARRAYAAREHRTHRHGARIAGRVQRERRVDLIRL